VEVLVTEAPSPRTRTDHSADRARLVTMKPTRG
jgi:hypothetical protein